MMKRTNRKGNARAYGSVNIRRRLGQAGIYGKRVYFSKRDASVGKFVDVKLPAASVRGRVFVGPSVEGVDVEYVEVVSGKVSNRKPSFAR